MLPRALRRRITCKTGLAPAKNVAHFPWWFDESSVRTLTTFNWIADVFPVHFKPDPVYKAAIAQGQAVLSNPAKTVESVDPIHYALRIKYGADVFKRFFAACAEAGRKGEIDFTPGRHLNKEQIVRFMSAAGEDVGPLYRRWTGFAAEK